MACFHPVNGYRAINGGFSLTRRGAYTDRPLTVPCGQCIGCRLDKSQDWATRIHHEASQHEATSFLTLTYGPEHLPEDYSVSVREVQLFMKRLRKALGHSRVRFFACGEYGDLNLRPHYHLVLFGYDFPDKVPWRKTGSGMVTYRSDFLDRVWTKGHAEIGTVTVQSAAYVARYVIKKVTGKAAEDHYTRTHPTSGLIWNVRPEFICMSTKPGIGAGWFNKFKSDAFPSDFVVIEGKKRPVPRYYAKKLDDDARADLASARRLRASKHADNNTPERLATREESAELKLANLHRELDLES